MRTRSTRSTWLIALGAILLGGLAALGWVTFGGQRIHAAPPAAPARPAQTVVDMQNSFVGVAQAVKPAVVSIQSRMTVQPQPTPDLDFGPFGGMPGMQGPSMRPRTAIGTGSGFIVRPDGWIMTNDHVVAGADRVTVRLDDGREFTGEVRRDFRSDLALVKIPADNLPTLSLADSGKVQVGQWAIAFGSPYGLRDTMTLGIVSALGRESVIGEQQDSARFYPDLIQTDASINPGNSGGPLLDINGYVMGVNVAIGSPTGSSVGIGFAIPANTAKYVMDQLIAKGSVTRGFLGFVPENLTPTQQAHYGVKQGVLVTGVEDNSPAAKAGLEVEDIITRFNNEPVTSESDLRDAIARATPGQKVPITVIRNGKEQTLTATVEAAPSEQTAQQIQEQQRQQGRLGVQVADLTPEIARQLGIDPNTKGVVVAGVMPGSPASEAGLHPGDILLKVNGKDVTSASQVADVAKSLKSGDTVNVIVRRDKNRVLLQALVP